MLHGALLSRVLELGPERRREVGVCKPESRKTTRRLDCKSDRCHSGAYHEGRKALGSAKGSRGYGGRSEQRARVKQRAPAIHASIPLDECSQRGRQLTSLLHGNADLLGKHIGARGPAL